MNWNSWNYCIYLWKMNLKLKHFIKASPCSTRDHLVVKIYEAVVNKSNFFQKKPVVTRQFDIKCSFLVPAHEKQQQKARAHAVWCKNALCAGSHCACPQTKWRNVSYLWIFENRRRRGPAENWEVCRPKLSNLYTSSHRQGPTLSITDRKFNSIPQNFNDFRR